MKVFYYVMAHRLPAQLGLLARSLQGAGDQVHVHVDRKVDLEPFQKAVSGTNARLVTRRRSVYWGGFSQVKCVVEGLTLFRESGCDYFVLLSGQDLPIKPVKDLKAYLRAHQGKVFITLKPAAENWDLGHLGRNSIYFFVDFWSRLHHAMPWARYLLNKTEGFTNRMQSLVARRKLTGATLYGGSSWLALPASAAKVILDVYAKDKNLVRYFRFCISADEMIFHTIIGNHLPQGHILPSLTFASFPEGQRNPRILVKADLDLLKERPEFFARKFDMESDREIVEQLTGGND